jgi:hypothetical protein
MNSGLFGSLGAQESKMNLNPGLKLIFRPNPNPKTRIDPLFGYFGFGLVWFSGFGFKVSTPVCAHYPPVAASYHKMGAGSGSPGLWPQPLSYLWYRWC